MKDKKVKFMNEKDQIISLRHIDTSDCIDIETAYQKIVESVIEIYKENHAL